MTSEELTEKANAAFRAIVPDVIQRAKLANTPIIVWENGRIKEIPWQEFERLSPSEDSAGQAAT